jgi:hypothetical protein
MLRYTMCHFARSTTYGSLAYALAHDRKAKERRHINPRGAKARN